MSLSNKKNLINMPALLLGAFAFLGAIVSTQLLRNIQFPIGWNYLALFLLAGLTSTFGRGIFRWVLATWAGALVMLYVGSMRQEGYLIVPASLQAMQYLPAVLTGALLGEWLRFRLSRLRGLPFSPTPYWHALIAASLVLLLLPLITFAYASAHTLTHPGVMALLMFTPGNTPFLFPSLITAALCGYWIRTTEVAAPKVERCSALLVMILSLLLIVAVLFIKVLFGMLEVA
jgi:hypothetical protein